MFKQLGILLFLFVITHNSFSQKNGDTSILIKGFYVSEKEAGKKSPSIRKSFTYKLQSGVQKDGDSIWFTNDYKFDDTSMCHCKYFGFCDGNDVFVRILDYEDMFSAKRYYKLKYPSKFSFICINPTNMIVSASNNKKIKVRILPFGSSSLFLPKAVWYFDKKGIFREATEQAFFFMLKGDKDLSKAFGAERYKNAATYVKYLTLLNERYK